MCVRACSESEWMALKHLYKHLGGLGRYLLQRKAWAWKMCSKVVS